MCKWDPANMFGETNLHLRDFRVCNSDYVYVCLREFVKTHVILAPLREFPRSRAASKIPFPGARAGKPGKPGKPGIFHFRCKNRYLRSRVI